MIRLVRLTGVVLATTLTTVEVPLLLIPQQMQTQMDLTRVVQVLGIISILWGAAWFVFIPLFAERLLAILTRNPKLWGAVVLKGLDEVRADFRVFIDEIYDDRVKRSNQVGETVMENMRRLNDMEKTMGRAAAALEHMPQFQSALEALNDTLSRQNHTLEMMQREMSEGRVQIGVLTERTDTIARRQSEHYEGIEKRHQSRRASDRTPDE